MPTIQELKGNPYCRQVSEHWAREAKRLRGTRYNARGERIGTSGPRRVVNEAQVREVLRETERQNALPKPKDWKPFDVATFTPVSGKLLVKRPDPVTEIDGIALPPADWVWADHYEVVRASDGSQFTPGQRVIFSRKHKPREVKLEGLARHYISREAVVVAVVED